MHRWCIAVLKPIRTSVAVCAVPVQIRKQQATFLRVMQLFEKLIAAERHHAQHAEIGLCATPPQAAEQQRGRAGHVRQGCVLIKIDAQTGLRHGESSACPPQRRLVAGSMARRGSACRMGPGHHGAVGEGMVMRVFVGWMIGRRMPVEHSSSSLQTQRQSSRRSTGCAVLFEWRTTCCFVLPRRSLIRNRNSGAL